MTQPTNTQHWSDQILESNLQPIREKYNMQSDPEDPYENTLNLISKNWEDAEDLQFWADYLHQIAVKLTQASKEIANHQ